MATHDFDEHATPFSEADLTADPFELFRSWYEDAIDSRPGDWMLANAMSLATVDANGRPHARLVLMKSITPRGIVFFTNYDSPKGMELTANPVASATFHWPHRYRQVRLEGTVRRTSREVSDTYFHSRPRGSQISASISKQSAIVSDRRELEERYLEYDEQYRGEPIPLPENWGGLEIAVDMIEFWQSRKDRLHDRFRYGYTDEKWNVDRLEP